ncbi:MULTISPECIES: hypothetical protein [Sphingomonas]|jgi:hypothetical protein|uniref:hypothetical protein n=1 Tax=Sphingomonas TaxID=13687 RepID=UPI001AE69211|nr:hypothetical protein [Sphingomonas sp. PvP018]MBP2512241.1 hypothetical protein [Sphingomonas sp. PvP018]
MTDSSEQQAETDAQEAEARIIVEKSLKDLMKEADWLKPTDFRPSAIAFAEVCVANTLAAPRSMTAAEKKAVLLLGDAWNALLECGVTGPEPCAHIHALQHAVMARTAQRLHPEIFR